MAGKQETDPDELLEKLKDYEAAYIDVVHQGAPSQGDIARAMRNSPGRASQIREQLVAEHPELEVEFHDALTERAIAMWAEGATWRKIANACGYSSAQSARTTVEAYVGGNMRDIWEWVGEE